MKNVMKPEKWDNFAANVEHKRDETYKRVLEWVEKQANYDTKYIAYGLFNYKQQ